MIYSSSSLRESLQITVETFGPSLEDYELRLEKKLKDGRLVQSSIFASSKSQRGQFERYFRKAFPLEDPVSLFDGEESLRFKIKFRPLTYKQMVEDMGDNVASRDWAVGDRAMKFRRDIGSVKRFCTRRLTDMSNKRKAEGHDSDETSLLKFKAELMTELSKLQDAVQ